MRDTKYHITWSRGRLAQVARRSRMPPISWAQTCAGVTIAALSNTQSHLLGPVPPVLLLVLVADGVGGDLVPAAVQLLRHYWNSRGYYVNLHILN